MSFRVLLFIYVLHLLCAGHRAQATEQPQHFEAEERSLTRNDSAVKVLAYNQVVPTIIDSHVDYANACLIVGYYVNGAFQGNEYASNIYRQYSWKRDQARAARGSKNNAPPVQRVGNIEELTRAIANCPVGSTLVLGTHGFSGHGGGFWLHEDKRIADPHAAGIVVMQGNASFDKFVAALAKRRIGGVILHSCEVGKEAAGAPVNVPEDPRVTAAFGNRLANEIYKATHALLSTDEEKRALRRAQVETYSEPVYGTVDTIHAKVPGTRRLIFNTDEAIVAQLNPGSTSTEERPAETAVAFRSSPSTSTPVTPETPRASTPSQPETSETPRVAAQPRPPAVTVPVMPEARRVASVPSQAPVSNPVFAETSMPVASSTPRAQTAFPAMTPQRTIASPTFNSTPTTFADASSSPQFEVAAASGLPAAAGGAKDPKASNAAGGGAGSGNGSGAGGSGSPSSPSSSSSGGGRGTALPLAIDPLPPIKVPSFGNSAITRAIQGSVVDNTDYSWVKNAFK